METTEADQVAVKVASLPTCPWCDSAPRVVPWKGDRAATFILECGNDRCAVQPSVSGLTIGAAAKRWSHRLGQPAIKAPRKYERRQQPEAQAA